MPLEHSKDVDKPVEKAAKAPEFVDTKTGNDTVDTVKNEAEKAGENAIHDAERTILNFHAIEEMTREQAQGNNLSEAETQEKVLKAKLERQKGLEDLRHLTSVGEYENWSGGTFFDTDSGPATAAEFVDYPLIKSQLNVPDDVSVKGLFKNLNKVKMQNGDHLLISPDKTKVAIVRNINKGEAYVISDSDFKQIAGAEITPGKLDETIAAERGYKIIDGQVKFTSQRALAKKTLGKIAKEQKWGDTLIVNGKLAVEKGGEYYNVVKAKNDSYALAKKRVLVMNGTKVETKIPNDMVDLAQTVKKQSV